MNGDTLKRMAAEAALRFVRPGTVLGVGTGSTADHFIDLVAERCAGDVPAAVASSERSAARLRGHGISVKALNEVTGIEVYVDGADEVGPQNALTKGGGGALTREKIVAEASRRFVCIVDGSKVVRRLGAFALPVEVIPMARALVARRLERLGGQPRLREGFVTDNGNEILDVHGLEIEDPRALETAVETIPGVVCCGLFARRPADVVLVARADGVEEIAAARQA